MLILPRITSFSFDCPLHKNMTVLIGELQSNNLITLENDSLYDEFKDMESKSSLNESKSFA